MTLPVRVMVLDAWDEVRLDLPESAGVRDLKSQALRLAGVVAPPERYLVKLHGAEVPETGGTLAEAGIAPNDALIVMSRRRVPVR